MIRLLLLLVAALATAHGHSRLAQSTIQAFLNVHNRLRMDTGADMPMLKWNGVLTKYAEKRVDECIYEHDPTHKYGENLYWTSIPQDPTFAAKDASEAWGSEVKYKDLVDNWGCGYGEYHKTCGHYMQQIWNLTTHMGCAINPNCVGQKQRHMVFCEYWPRGNMKKNGVNTAPY